MAQQVTLRHSTSGLMKTGYVGFSWTTFLFGGFVPLVRGDFKWFIIIVLLTLIIGVPTLGVGGLVVGLIFGFVYNKKHLESMLEKGFVPSDEHSANQIRATGTVISDPVPSSPGGGSADGSNAEA